jgi:23S rRNA (adenine2503-C2)-methyltransferase
MSRFDVGRAELEALLDGEPRYRVAQAYEGLFRRLREPGELTELPRALRDRLAAAPQLAAGLAPVAEDLADGGTTRKWLFRLEDGRAVETVLMAYRDRVTVCVSSQAGCAMGCSFCATGQAGFGRHLRAGEIVEQVARAARSSRELGLGELGNVVLMGMGEPLANYEAVLSALRRCNADLGIGARHMTVSTVGIVPGIDRLSHETLQVNLAVSLHAANDALRDRLVPMNRRYPLAALRDALERYRRLTRRRVSLEWALIDGVNDRAADARELAAFARPLGAHVNLIPLNPTPGFPARASSPARVAAFRAALSAAGVNVTVRRTRGRAIAAACGQLAGCAVIGAGGRGRLP